MHTKYAANQELDSSLARLTPGAHDPSHRTFVGDGDCLIAQFSGLSHQHLRGACTLEEGKFALTAKLGIVGQRHGSPKQALQKPARP